MHKVYKEVKTDLQNNGLIHYISCTQKKAGTGLYITDSPSNTNYSLTLYERSVDKRSESPEVQGAWNRGCTWMTGRLLH